MNIKMLAFVLMSCLCAISALAQDRVLRSDSSVRSGPSSKGRLIETLPAGTAVIVISEHPRSGYVKIEAKDGTAGWVLQRNVSERTAKEGEQPSPSANPASSGSRVGAAQIYPKSDMTPGKEDASVTQDNISQNICRKGWSTSSVRPLTSVTNKIKRDTMKAYGFTDTATHYELDHLISLQNGGCPDCVENLWPEAYGDKDHPMTQNERATWNRENPGSSEIFPGALEKDVVENHIHDEICFGIPNAKMSMYAKKYPPTVSVTLKRGQEILATDWYTCYVNIMNGNKPCE